jgi:hypothetical protein
MDVRKVDIVQVQQKKQGTAIAGAFKCNLPEFAQATTGCQIGTDA